MSAEVFKLDEGISSLKDDDLESTLAVSEFFTRFHKQILVAFSNDEVVSAKNQCDLASDQAIDVDMDGNTTSSTTGTSTKNEGEGDVVVSPNDVLSAFEYRYDMERYRLISSVMEIMTNSEFYPNADVNKKNSALEPSPLLEEEARRIWRRMQNRIGKGRLSTDRDVTNLIEVMEVRVAKEISTEMLLNSSNLDYSSGVQPSASVILGVPSGNYISKLFPKCIFKAENLKKDLNKESLLKSSEAVAKYYPTLCVPANSLTWRELLRISTMISKVPKDKRWAVFSSPLTNAILNGAIINEQDEKRPNIYIPSKDRIHGEDKLLLSEGSVLRGTDLAALWVRAKRDTGASIHLLALFEIKKILEEKLDNGEESVNHRGQAMDLDEIPKEISISPLQNIGDDSSPRYTASFVGNPKKLKNRIDKEALLIDKLVEWAIMNQVYFRENHIRNIGGDMGHKPNSRTKKRKRNGYDSDLHSKGSNAPTALQFSYQAHVLKWFYRRNRTILEVIATSNSLQNEELVQWLSSKNIDCSDIAKEMKRYFNEKFHSTDRTLDRIERRILLQKYQEFSDFQNAISNLLEALESALANSEDLVNEVRRARDDFVKLCEFISYNEGSLCGTLLENKHVMDKESVAKILTSQPSPWYDKKRFAFSKHVNKEDSQVCWNCDPNMIKSSLPSESGHLSTFLDDYKYLRGVLLSAQDLPEEPDFVSNPMQWERKTIFLKRDRINGGELPRWGMTIQNTELCEEALEKCWHNSTNPLRWNEIDKLSTNIDALPIRLPHVGMIVKQSKGPSRDSGLLEGDVIVEVEVRENSKSSNGQEYSEMKILKEIKNGNDRKRFMMTSSETMIFTIYRPSKAIINIASTFRDAVIKAYENESKTFERLFSQRWYCQNCEFSKDLPAQAAIGDARLCQILIRQLGMEECFLPFNEEDGNESVISDRKKDDESTSVISIDSASTDGERSTSECFDHFKYASLRRLDGIFSILTSSSASKLEQNASIQGQHTPPWTKREKLCWINEENLSDPFRLLCTCIVLIVRRAKDRGFDRKARQAIVDNFVLLFVPWCLDYKRNTHVSKGPPIYAQTQIAPWLLDSCRHCLVYPVTNQYSDTCAVCSAAKMRKLDCFEREPWKPLLYCNGTFNYDLYCSYIGTSIIISLDDPLVTSVKRKTQLIVDEGRRSVELLIISYVPKVLLLSGKMKGLVYEESRESFDERLQRAEGLFYVLPIFSHYQLTFISQYCDVGKPGESPSDSQMLSLDGIIALTPSEFMSRLQASSAMQAAVDREVESIVTRFGFSKLAAVNGNDKKETPNKLSNCPKRSLVEFVFPNIEGFTNGIYRGDASKHRTLEISRFAWALDLCFSKLNPDVVSSFLEELHGARPEDKVSDSLNLSTGSEFNLRLDKVLAYRKSKRSSTDKIMNIANLQNGLVSFEKSLAERNTECLVWYSDMYYWNSRNKNHEKVKNDMDQLGELVSKQILLNPGAICPPAKRYTFAIHRTSFQNDDESEEEEEEDYVPENSHIQKNATFYGKGWGFELVRWIDRPRILRVGRIVPTSPAEMAGLRAHDIVTAINGKPIQTIETQLDLAAALLADGKEEGNHKLKEHPTLPFLFRLRKKRPLQGPIIINVVRPKINAPVAHDEPITQTNHRQASTTTLNASQAQHPTTIEKSVLVPNQHRQRQPQPVRDSNNSYSSSVPHYQNGVRRNHGARVYAVQPQPVQIQARPLSTPHLPQQPQPVQIQHRPLSTPQQHHPQHQYHPRHQYHPPQQQQQQQQHTRNLNLPEQLVDTGDKRELLQFKHLYQTSVNDCFLSLAETSVLVHAISNNHPKLSTRLLNPRYSLRRVNDEYTQRIKPHIEAHGYNEIPDLNHAMWQSILKYDHKRMQVEIGPILFYEDNFGYREPTQLFPIDRFFEQYFKRNGQQRRAFDYIDLSNGNEDLQNNEIASLPATYQHQSDPGGDVMRIRGGGDDDCFQKPIDAKLLGSRHLVHEIHKSAHSLLGVLPDGRLLHRFISDPDALYISNNDGGELGIVASMKSLEQFERNAEEARKQNLAFLDTNYRKAYACPWGCCGKKGTSTDLKECQILSFDTSNQLQDHINEYHAYSRTPKATRFERISNRKSIQDLCADLTWYLFSSSIHLRQYMRQNEIESNSKTKEGILRLHSPKSLTFDFDKFPRSIDQTPFENVSGIKALLPTIKLWEDLSFIFRIESDATLRVQTSVDQCGKKDCDKLENVGDEKLLIDGIENDIELSHKSLEDTTKTGISDNLCKRFQVEPAEALNCMVCRNNRETMIKLNQGEGHHGIGCSLTSELCYVGINSVAKEKILVAIKKCLPMKSDIDVLRVLLMKVAASIPPSLRKTTPMAMFSEPPKSFFWEKIEKWIDFASRCLNIRMVAQAVIMLNASINTGKMPRWWKSAKCGWSSPVVISQNPSVSSISCFLFTFDIAISEYAVNAKDGMNRATDSNPSEVGDGTIDIMSPSSIATDSEVGYEPQSVFVARLEKMNVKDKFKLLETLATKFGLPPHDDEHDDVCMTCGSGGDLLCCEYCQNVIHQQCIGYEGNLEEVIFVCKECVTDITTLKEAWDREKS